jgi:hypothetical protein
MIGEIFMNNSVYVENKLYDGINQLASNNPKEQLMLFGGNTKNGNVYIDFDSIKWFTENELEYNDTESVAIDQKVLVSAIVSLRKRGYDSVIMIHTHPCENDFDDFLYGSLSEEDVGNSKKLLLICQFQNVSFYDGVSTGKSIYFWNINNESLIPKHMDCYVDGKLVEKAVPGTIQELFQMIKSTK